MICNRCNAQFPEGYKFCIRCGSPLTAVSNQAVQPIPNVQMEAIANPLYVGSTSAVIEKIVDFELQSNGFNKEKETLPSIKKRKRILTLIFAFLNFFIICGVFFHFSFPILFFIELLNIICYIFFQRHFTPAKYIAKQIKARPDDSFENIVASIAAEKMEKSTSVMTIISILISCILPLLIFFKPMVFYEKYEEDGLEGYFVRFYTIGVTNFTSVTIPEEYKGQKVVGIRGNVFKNMYLVREINLPDTIEIIRGHAFENDMLLTEINLPENLTYLGGYAFKNCYSLTSITIPEGVTEIRGNTFENCESLESVELPPYMTEIHAYAFSGCSSLKEITIPYGVTRIGARAFFGCYLLSKVEFPDTLEEIGSSAFRECSNLKEVYLPEGTSVSQKAFKDSPTSVRRKYEY